MHTRRLAAGALLALLCLAATPSSQPTTKPHLLLRADAPSTLARFWYGQDDVKKPCLEELRVRLNDANHELTRIENAHVGAGEAFPDRDAKVTARRQQLAAVERLKQLTTLVRNADGTMVTNRHVHVGVGSVFQLAPSKVFEVIDEHNVIVTLDDSDGDVWITGVHTDKLTDNSVVGGKILHITGTRRYQTAAGGQRTVFEAKVLDIGEFLEE